MHQHPRIRLTPGLAAGDRGLSMLDIILVAVGCGLFALAIAYAYACDRL
ncbi:MAG: hypothetical protein U1E60_31940 [Reyranellaceae bacterium]